MITYVLMILEEIFMTNLNPMFYIYGLLSALLFFIVQYILLSKTNSTFIRLIPVYFVVAIIVFAFIIYIQDGGTFTDLKNVIALLLLMLALICLISIILANYLYKRGTRNERK